MAVAVAQRHSFDMDTQASTNLTAAELRYQQHNNAIEFIFKDEEARKLKLDALVLGDDIDKLNEQLFEETERGDAAEVQAQSWREEAADAEERVERTLSELRTRNRELEAMKAELLAMQDVSADSTKLLTEKLALSRELSTLRPELEHLRATVSTNDGLLSEKLSLQHQLEATQVELTSEKRNLKRVIERQGANSDHDAEREAEIEALRTELTKEKRERSKAEKVAVKASEEQVEDLKKELAKEKKLREKVEKASTEDTESQIKELRKELVKEKKLREKAENAVAEDADNQVKELRKELVKEKREREKEAKLAGQSSNEGVAEIKADLIKERQARKKAEDATSSLQEQHEHLQAELTSLRRDQDKVSKAATKASTTQLEDLKRELSREKDEREALNEKLNQFREKLRATKDKLKTTEAELLAAQQIAAQSPQDAAKTVKNPRKRAAVQIDPDATIGTPGDAVPAKRSKRASSVLGEKSTFSITPFLNRTASVAPGDYDQDEPVASIEAASPTATKTKPAQKKSAATALVPADANKLVRRPSASAAGRKKQIVPSITLQTVAEEASGDEDEEAAAQPKQPTQPQRSFAAPTTTKPQLKPRKSLASFASFRDGSLPPQPLAAGAKNNAAKKKRKLGASVLAKTIFDEDDEDGDAPIVRGRQVSVGMGGQRAFGGFGALTGGFGASLLTANKGTLGGKQKGPLMIAKDGFMFSPLKKDRKAMAGL